MALKRRYRRILYVLGALLAGVLLIWVCVPLWFPWVLRPWIKTQNASFNRYERIAYGRFALHGLSYSNQNVRLQANRVEAVTPHVWLWRIARGTATGQKPFLQVSDWRLDSLPGGPAESGTESSVTAIFHDGTQLLETLLRWLPEAVVSNGVIHVSGTAVELPLLIWSAGRLEAKVGLPDWDHGAVLKADFSRGPPYDLRLESDSLHLQSTVQVTTNLSGLQLEATSYWRSNRIELEAEFGRTGYLPETASLQATNWHIPAEMVPLPNYQDIRGSLMGTWQEGRFAVKLNAGARPISPQTNLPPLEASLEARGDTNSALVHTVVLTASWLRAELSGELQIHFRGPWLREPGRLKVSADLARQPWVPLEGTLLGEVRFAPGTGNYPTARFEATGTNVGNADLKAESLRVRGGLDWPWLEVGRIDINFEGQSAVAAEGRMNLSDRAVAGGHLELRGPLAQPWFPSGVSYDELLARVDLHGPLEQLVHTGQVEVAEFTSPGLRPLELKANWRGEGLNLDDVSLQVSSGESTLQAAGALEVTPAATNLWLKNLTLLKGGERLLALEEAARFSFEAGAGTNRHWSAQLDSLHWFGPAGELRVADAALVWPHAGRLRGSAQGLRAGLMDDFLESPLPAIRLENLKLAGGWTNGPAHFELEASGSAEADHPISAHLKLIGDGRGLDLRELVVSERNSPALTAQGFVPLMINPVGEGGLIQLEADGPLRLEAASEPQAAALERIAEWLGFSLQQPRLTAHLTGTWNHPQGAVQVEAERIARPEAGSNMPVVTDLRMELQLDRKTAHLTRGELLVQGQPVSLTAEVPLGNTFWTGLGRKGFPDWQEITARLRIQGAEVAAFAELYPGLLSPQGELNVDVSVLPGGIVHGLLQLQNARTRPLPNLGPLREIQLQVRFEDRIVRFEDASANLGGATVRLTGEADLSGTNWLRSGMPPFVLALSGEHVPLTRQPEIIIRSDVDLTIVNSNGAPPLVGGVVQLRNSYFLSDLGDLVPGGVTGPRRRPPYFSIENPLLDDWRLAVQVTGDEFLKIRSPLFNGAVSANLNMQGTLKDPIALGSVRIDSGQVRFPFGSLEVQQGSVTITSENPYRPELLMRAESKQFGFNIRMEVTGPADAPVVQFSSTPPLTSQQILLLLTAGEIPGGEYAMTAQQRAQALAVFLGRELLSKLGFGDTGEARLSVRSGEEISEAGRPTYRVEFKLTDDWSLVAEYDRFGDYNVGAQWRFYSK